jgi:hypothetical protein
MAKSKKIVKRRSLTHKRRKTFLKKGKKILKRKKKHRRYKRLKGGSDASNPTVHFIIDTEVPPMILFIGYIPNEEYLPDYLAGKSEEYIKSLRKGGFLNDAYCKIQADDNYIRLNGISMGFLKGKHKCKYLFRETLNALFNELKQRDISKYSKLFLIDVQGDNAERARALNCYNSVLNEFNYTVQTGGVPTPGGPRTLNLDDLSPGPRLWKNSVLLMEDV